MRVYGGVDGVPSHAEEAWEHDATRCLVTRAAGDSSSPGWLRHLFDVGGVSGSALRVGSVPFSLLFSIDPGVLVAPVAGDFDPLDAPGLSGHVLFLPQGLLPLDLPTTSGLRSGRWENDCRQGAVVFSKQE